MRNRVQKEGGAGLVEGQGRGLRVGSGKVGVAWSVTADSQAQRRIWVGTLYLFSVTAVTNYQNLSGETTQTYYLIVLEVRV